MASTSIGDLLMKVVADMTGFETQVTKEAAAAGDKAGVAAGTSFGKRLAGSVKTHGAMVIGTALAAGFGIATKGALELENAVARFQAETGASADEAKRAGTIINRVAGEERMSLEAVTDIAIRVKRDLGATGEAADLLTKQFARFARVTRQDGATAVAAFDDVLDSWGLQAADAGAIMDKLLVSQQKFGGDIAQTTDSLAKLAAPMRAANFEIDDGIALLGLFGSKGLDAQQGAAAFAKALTKVKSPEELQHLIDDIVATEDPFKRAQKAADLFGAKAGAKLANALGGVDLKKYRISMDEAAGATERAADALDSTFSGRIQKAISVATANLREFGASFGPALTGVAALATLLAPIGGGKLVKGLIGPLVAFPGKFKALVVKGIMGAIIPAKIAGEAVGVATAEGTAAGAAKGGSRFGVVGKLWGSILGKAFVAAALVYIGVELYQELERITKANADATKALGEKVGTQVAEGTVEGLQTSKAAIQKAIADLDLAQGLFGGDARNATVELQKQLAIIEAEIKRRTETMAEHTRASAFGVGEALAGGVADGVEDHSADVSEKLRGAIFPSLGKLTEQAAILAKRYGGKTATEFAAGILEKQGAVKTAFSALINQQQTEMKRGQELAYNIGVLTSKELADGLKDGRPGVRAQAEYTKKIALDRIAELVKNGRPLGKKAANALKLGLKDKNPEIRTQAQAIRDTVTRNIKPKPATVYNAGYNTGTSFMNGLRAAIRVGGVLITTEGRRAPGRATGGNVVAGRPYLVNENTPRSELYVPDISGRVYPALTPAVGGGGNVFNISIAPGPDTSPVAAHRFGQQVMDVVADGLRRQTARR